MTFKKLTEFDLLSPSQQVINLLIDSGELSQKSNPEILKKADKLRNEASKLINKYSAKKLFEPDETLGKNVLHYAIFTNNPVIAIDLINKKGATPEQLFHPDTHGFTPLHDAIHHRQEMVAEALIKKATSAKQLSRENFDGITPLQMAKEHHMSHIKAAINARIDALPKDLIQTTLPFKVKRQQQSALEA